MQQRFRFYVILIQNLFASSVSVKLVFLKNIYFSWKDPLKLCIVCTLYWRINDSYAEILKGLRCYFDKALPAMLLYKKERQQYSEEVKGDVSPSTIYGAEHLLRLFGMCSSWLHEISTNEWLFSKVRKQLGTRFIVCSKVYFLPECNI
jgi:hypothetical protein